ncbi:HVA22-like protein a [Striga hermonthica]|uniref:HVA22-like protein a n=1 Tax=Striga hermonthica TaxID=68872 RepID=A0A9N7MJ20_STRHE|nr:HVA22-like protein a [Striga hermonthica]
MGFLILLKLSLLCVDLFAWPVIALGYPLIPFWSKIKLATILWLVVPRFNGACYAYQSFIRPYLIVNVQEAIRRFEEQSRTSETFLDVADKYMKENGVEALEKLIAAKKELKESDDSQRGSRVQEPDEKNVEATLKLPKEPDAAEKDKGILETPKGIEFAATEVTKVRLYKEVLETPKGIEATEPIKPVSKEKAHAPVLNNKDTIAPQKTTSDQNKQPINLKAVPPAAEWTCHLCQVSTTSEKNMNDHLRGNKHTSMLQSLKSSKLSNNNTTKDHPSPGSSSGREGGPKQESTLKPKNIAQKLPVKKPTVGVQNNFKHWCALCDVQVSSDITLGAHLKGKKHWEIYTHTKQHVK